MKWKKVIGWISFMVIGFVCGTSVGLMIFNSPTESEYIEGDEVEAALLPTEKPYVYEIKETPVPSKVKTKFLLTLSGSKVCMYELNPDGTTTLLQETEIDLSQLRREDYENLCRGYTVNSLEEAKLLCEDFKN